MAKKVLALFFILMFTIFSVINNFTSNTVIAKEINQPVSKSKSHGISSFQGKSETGVHDLETSDTLLCALRNLFTCKKCKKSWDDWEDWDCKCKKNKHWGYSSWDDWWD
ncbi:uncharacterized protein LOC141849994 [Brevipalpus obovatus]|uniref:uncharacterized protein LOC141849994 n=1 Tax=Brevipalpus obovatus TaxID=246614 RepID=UPI003D9FA31A